MSTSLQRATLLVRDAHRTVPGTLSVIDILKSAAILIFLAAASPAAWAVCVTPPSNMMAWWTLDEPGTTVFDRRSHTTGTVHGGASTISAFVGNGLIFNGIDGYVEIPHHPQIDIGTGDFSIDLWLRTPKPRRSRELLVILDKRDTIPMGYSLFIFNGNLGLQLADATGYGNFISEASVADGKYHHVAVTVSRRQSDGIRFYLDGLPAGVADPTSRQGNLSNFFPLRLGARSADLSGFWRGVLDEVELFSRALTPTEVASLYSARRSGKCKCTELVTRPLAWWGFNEATGNVVHDLANIGPYDGSAQGVERIVGKVSGGLRFQSILPSVGAFVTIPNSQALGIDLSTPGGFTVDAWVRTPSGASSAGGPIVDGSFEVVGPTDINTTQGYSLSLDDLRQPTFAVVAQLPGFSGAPGFITSVGVVGPPIADDGLWHLIGATLTWVPGPSDRRSLGVIGTAALYVDGFLVGASAPATLSGSANGAIVTIGASHAQRGGRFFFSGDLDEVEIFDRALVQDDFLAIFLADSAGKCQKDGPSTPATAQQQGEIPTNGERLPPCLAATPAAATDRPLLVTLEKRL